jgi:hypothetical protein
MKLSNLKPVAAAAVTILVTLGGCRPNDAAPQPGSEARLETQFPGESWHASTRAPVPSGGRLAWISIEEDVRLDPSGRLSHAVTRSRDDANLPEVKVTFDPPSRTVVVERAGRRIEWTVPGDEPWILAPVKGPAGEVVPTPLVAWTTYRATRDTEWVRLVLPLEQKSYVVPRDQYVVDRAVVVGDQAVEVDDHFVRTITIGGVELARGALGSAFRFHGG